ncbi:MAG: S-layer homology domain-containing protein [Clostridia bacterium]|nr:S-layer homology domain-containing protein [Clostridia bacterium]
MKKRIWAILLSLCLLMGLVPVTAMADETFYTSYEQFKEAAETDTYNSMYMRYYSFTWPTDSDTINIKRPIYIESDWEIPSNITLNFTKGSNSQGMIIANEYYKDKMLIINGTVTTEVSNPLRCSVTIKNGAVIKSTGNISRETVISPGYKWIVEEGGELAAETLLLGILTGNGKVSGEIDVRGAYQSTNSNAELSGNLELSNNLTVGSYSTQSNYTDTLTIPSGSNIKFAVNGYKLINVYKRGTLKLNGTLDISGDAKYGRDGIIIAEGGSIVMNDGVLSLHSPYGIGESGQQHGDVDITRLESPYIKGNGTIAFHGEESYYGLFYFDVDEALSHVYPDELNYIENGIEITHDWSGCEHDWTEWETIKEPTETEDGIKIRSCKKCKKVVTEIITALGENTDSGDDEKDENDTSTSKSPSYSLSEKKGGSIDVENTVKGNENESEQLVFSDVNRENPNYDAIMTVYENGWMEGIGDGVFAPEGTLTRAMAAQILWNKAGNPEPKDAAPFLDVTSDVWYAKAIAWIYEQGIMLGYDEAATTFGPDDYVTMEQFEIMTAKYNGEAPAPYTGVSPNATRGWVASLLVL